MPHQWPSGSVLKTGALPVAERFSAWGEGAGRREVPGSISDRACRSNRSEFSVVFSETLLNMG